MVKVKICGIKTLQDVEFVNRQKPDFTGFVFYPLSKRYVSLITARSLKAKLNKKIKSIGVFVNAPPEEIAAAAELGIITWCSCTEMKPTHILRSFAKYARCQLLKPCA